MIIEDPGHDHMMPSSLIPWEWGMRHETALVVASMKDYYKLMAGAYE
jgi:hypothetical protein